MKKTRYIFAAAAALALLAGCAKEKDTLTPSRFRSGGLYAVIEQDETRVSFDDLGKFTWDEGDQIAVYVGNGFETVDVDPETGAFKVTGTGDRSFYAVYPATAAPATNAALTVTIPDSYDISGITDKYFSPVPMVAQNLQDQDELYFLHVGGLVRIFGDVDTPASTAVVTFDKDVTGTYTVDTSNGAAPTITTGGTTSNNTVTFTLPANSTKFVLNVPVPCGTYESVKVALDGGTAQQINTTPLTFARHHGKVLEVGEVTFTYHLDGLHDVEAEYLGGSKEVAQIFASYKTPDGGVTKVGVPFIVEFSEDGETGWAVDANPDWLRVTAGVDYSGSTTGEPLQVTIDPQANTAVDEHANILAARTEKNGFDLSTINVATGAPVARTTANSYVVDAPGTYKFPLVYGNGVKDGAINETAFHGTVGFGGAFRDVDYTSGTCNDIEESYTSRHGLLGYFKDHRDNDITSPYILTHFANLGYTNVTLTPEIMWMDALSNNGSGPLNGRLLIQNVAVDGSGEDAYITFEVPAESIQQGNVEIALKATYTVGSGETAQTFTDVVWCWHIWVTDQDMKAVAGPNTTAGLPVSFAPVNMGWRDTRETARYNERVWYIRVKQTEDDGAISDPLMVLSRAGDIIIEHGGRSLTYQFGRKDPRAGTYNKTVGKADPKPTSGSLYVGYNLPEAYITAIGSVPEMREEWRYSDYRPGKEMVTDGTIHVCKNVTLFAGYTFQFLENGVWEVEEGSETRSTNFGYADGVSSYVLGTEFNVAAKPASSENHISIAEAGTYDIILDPVNKKAKIISTQVVGDTDPYASFTASTWKVMPDYGVQTKYSSWDDPATELSESITLVLNSTIGTGIRYPRVSFGGTRIHAWLNCTWQNMWDSSISSTSTNNASETMDKATKTIYDPCPVGYRVPTPDCWTGLTTENTPYAEVDRVEGRQYNGTLFFPFIPATGAKTKLARYSDAVLSGSNSRALFDIYPEYVYGRTGESMSGNYVVRPVQE